jgi:PAS domain S-box-containing protein
MDFSKKTLDMKEQESDKADELTVLESHFHNLADEVVSSREELERRVEERTVKLEKANAFLSQEINERKHAEEALKRSEQSYRTLAENIPVIIYRVYTRENNRIQFFSKVSELLIGYKENELEKGEVCSIESLIYPQDRPKVIAEVKQAIADNKSFALEYRLRHKNGDIKYVLENGKPITGEDGKTCFIEGVIHDITEHKKAEEQVKASLKEKEVLLQEIHHRVKNNMSVITSLLRLQSGKIEDEQYKDIFKNSINRIKTMALIHEKLYKSKDLAKVNFSDYLKDMINSMFMSYELSSHKVALKIDVEDVAFGVDTAIPCGLIINELVSNSLKYAFPDDRKGEIKVAISLNHRGEVQLTVSDNGVGVPENLDFRKKKLLGVNVVNDVIG